MQLCEDPSRAPAWISKFALRSCSQTWQTILCKKCSNFLLNRSFKKLQLWAGWNFFALLGALKVKTAQNCFRGRGQWSSAIQLKRASSSNVIYALCRPWCVGFLAWCIFTGSVLGLRRFYSDLNHSQAIGFVKPQCWSRWLNVYLREVRSIPDKATLVRILTRATRNHWITGQGGRGSPPGPLPAWASGRYTVWYTKTSSRASHDRLQSQDYRW